ncbi:thioesterase family protein [Acaricomes phytoseiuli]|uniref:thioesterase family protein n=1 Tax=Acaricomes phytoseiuli TaxID=291968 RepID=UPI0004754579|nr:thioesterase family protein [Acaricomes phytoseiuli]
MSAETSESLPEAAGYYVENGPGWFTSTLHAQGAWNPQEQHMAPVTGLLVRELENFQPRPELRLARVSFDILGMIPGGEFRVETSVLRPGKTIELIQAELIAGERPAVRATAWRLQRSDTTEVAATQDRRIPGLDSELDHPDTSLIWPGGFIRSLEIYTAPGNIPGRGQVWLRGAPELVADQPSSELARLMGLVDTANGIVPLIDPSKKEYIYPNTDLSIHLHREPSGEWLGLDTSVSFGADGIGLTSSVLHDASGPFGRAEQILTVRRLNA